LGARFHHRVKAKGGSSLLLACLPHDRHETGLLLFALAANATGYHTILLGSDMPLGDLPAVALKTGAKAIILSGTLHPGSQTLNHELPALSKLSPVPVFLGGNASTQVHDALKRSGIHVLGTDLATGIARLSDMVPAR